MLAAAPQRIDPRRVAPADPAARYDWQMPYRVIFDGTERCPLRRQIFAEESPTPSPEVLQRFVDAPAPRLPRKKPASRSIEAKSLVLLTSGDRTARDLAATLKAHEHSVLAILRRLRKEGVVRVVGHVDNPASGQGQRNRLVVYGVRS
jgi:hypothetical protein